MEKTQQKFFITFSIALVLFFISLGTLGYIHYQQKNIAGLYNTINVYESQKNIPMEYPAELDVLPPTPKQDRSMGSSIETPQGTLVYDRNEFGSLDIALKNKEQRTYNSLLGYYIGSLNASPEFFATNNPNIFLLSQHDGDLCFGLHDVIAVHSETQQVLFTFARNLCDGNANDLKITDTNKKVHSFSLITQDDCKQKIQDVVSCKPEGTFATVTGVNINNTITPLPTPQKVACGGTSGIDDTCIADYPDFEVIGTNENISLVYIRMNSTVYVYDTTTESLTQTNETPEVIFTQE